MQAAIRTTKMEDRQLWKQDQIEPANLQLEQMQMKVERQVIKILPKMQMKNLSGMSSQMSEKKLNKRMSTISLNSWKLLAISKRRRSDIKNTRRNWKMVQFTPKMLKDKKVVRQKMAIK